MTGDELSAAAARYDQGDIGGALDILDRVRAEAARTGDRELVFVTSLQKAGWLRDAGRMAEAATALRESETYAADLPREGHEALWSSLLMEQALVAQRRGDFATADTLLSDAEDMARQGALADLQVPDVLVNRAAGYLRTGRLRDAQAALTEALRIDERSGNLRNQANDLNMLGLLHGRLGDQETARAYLERSFATARQGGYARFAADAGTNLAALVMDQGDLDRARELFDALGSFWTDSTQRSGEACGLAEQGLLAARAGDPDQAAALLARAHELHHATGNTLHMVQDQINLCQLALQRDDHTGALALAEAARAAADEHGLIVLRWVAEYLVASARSDLAKQALAADVPADQVRAHFEAALAAVRGAADTIELLRANAGPPEQRQWLLADKEAVYDLAITLCVTMGRGTEAFEFAERARARAFLESLGADRLRRMDTDGPRRQELVARLLDPAVPAADKAGLQDELRILRAQAIADRPDTAPVTEIAPPPVAEICAAIPAGVRVLSYYQLGDAVLMFLLSRDGLLDAGLTTFPGPVAERVERFRTDIEDGDPDLDIGHEFYAALFRPQMANLTGMPDLIVIPHGALHHVPFGALWFEIPTGDGAIRQYLRKRFHLAGLPSASCLPLLLATPEPDEWEPPVVLGDPTGDLPGAAREAARVAALLDVTPCTGADASRAALLAAGDPLVLHVACHGRYDRDDPLLSGLVLADGVVTVEDLLRQGPAPRLLVLSGCVTGLSRRHAGDELVGLVQAALRNGTRAVVATLWETSDDASAEFFEHFYAALAGGASVSLAMMLAWDGTAETYPDVVDWGPFLLLGDPTTALVPTDGRMMLHQYADMAQEHLMAGEHGQAVGLYRYVLERQLDAFGPDHPDVLNTQSRLGGAYAIAGHVELAVPLFESALSTAERVLGRKHELTRSIRSNLRTARIQRRLRGWSNTPATVPD